MNQVEAWRLPLHSNCFCPTCHSQRPSKRSSRKRAIKRRKRKSLDQLRALQDQFDRGTEWSKELVTYLAQVTGLSEAQVYKWGWDQKKKIGAKAGDDPGTSDSLSALFEWQWAGPVYPAPPGNIPSAPVALHCAETILPSALDGHLYIVQKSYK